MDIGILQFFKVATLVCIRVSMSLKKTLSLCILPSPPLNLQSLQVPPF